MNTKSQLVILFSYLIPFTNVNAESFTSTKIEAKHALSRLLKDPYSVKWGTISLSTRGKLACITANAKNTYGAYDGNKQYVLAKFKSTDSFQYVQTTTFYNHQECFEFINGLDYQDTPEGREKFEQTQLLEKQKQDEMWKDIQRRDANETKKREDKWKDSEDKEHKIKEAEINLPTEIAEQEISVTDERKTNPDSIVNTIKTLESLKDFFK